MMLCSRCHKNPADVMIDAWANGHQTKLQLCESCARGAGLGPQSLSQLFHPSTQFPALSPVLAQLLTVISHFSQKSGRTTPPCPVCRWTMDDFQRTGKMGCPPCYAHFERETAAVLKNIHGSLVHKGKRSTLARKPTSKTLPTTQKRLEHLHSRLQGAVQAENYELAALLRDQIKKIKTPPSATPL